MAPSPRSGRARRALLTAFVTASVALPVSGAARPAAVPAPAPAAVAPLDSAGSSALEARYAAGRAEIRAARDMAARHGDRRRATALTAMARPGRTFLMFDGRDGGRGVEVVGDLSRARRIAVLVPGAGVDLDHYGRLRRGAGALLDELGSGSAVVAWLGYRTPGTVSPAALTPGRADEAAPHLRAFIRELSAAQALGPGLPAVPLLRLGGLRPGRVRAGGRGHRAVRQPRHRCGRRRADLRTGARVWAGRGADDWIAGVPHSASTLPWRHRRLRHRPGVPGVRRPGLRRGRRRPQRLSAARLGLPGQPRPDRHGDGRGGGPCVTSWRRDGVRASVRADRRGDAPRTGTVPSTRCAPSPSSAWSCGHWLVTALVADSGTLHSASPLQHMPWLAPISWVFQTLAVFFLVGGQVATSGYASARARGERTGSGCGARLPRLFRPVAARASPLWAVAAGVLLVSGVDVGDGAHAGQAGAVPAVVPAGVRGADGGDPAGGPAAPAVAAGRRPARRPVPVRARRPVLARLGERGGGLAGAVHAWARPGPGAGWTARRAGWVLLAGGTAATAALVLWAGYPASMVGVPGATISNLDPPTLAAVTFGLAQCGAGPAAARAACAGRCAGPPPGRRWPWSTSPR